MGGAFLSLQLTRWIAKRSTGMRLVDGRTGSEEADWVYRTVARLTQQAQLPMPEVGIYESAEVNAFATGPSRRRSLVAVSSGLLRSMRREEIEGVLAHEVTHIANGDMVTMALLQGVINAFVMFLARVIAFAIASRGNSRDDRSPMLQFMIVFVLQIVFGILGSIVVAWFSRQREFRADRGARRSRVAARCWQRCAGWRPTPTRWTHTTRSSPRSRSTTFRSGWGCSQRTRRSRCGSRRWSRRAFSCASRVRRDAAPTAIGC